MSNESIPQYAIVNKFFPSVVISLADTGEKAQEIQKELIKQNELDGRPLYLIVPNPHWKPNDKGDTNE